MFRKREFTLRGEKVVLVPYCSHHVSKYHEWMQNKELQELTASEPLTLDQEYDMQQSWLKDDDKCTYIILDKELLAQDETSEVGAMVGDVNLFLMKEPVETKSTGLASTAEVEVMIAEPSSRGKGLGQEAVKLMMSYGYCELGIKMFQVKIGKNNLASLNLFSNKLQFREVNVSDIFNEVTLELQTEEEKFKENILQTLKWSKYAT